MRDPSDMHVDTLQPLYQIRAWSPEGRVIEDMTGVGTTTFYPMG
jgi:hypothetical protein